ncbi:hypothetical protein Tco_0582650 [Tanacetum coccineum]
MKKTLIYKVDEGTAQVDEGTAKDIESTAEVFEGTVEVNENTARRYRVIHEFWFLDGFGSRMLRLRGS